MGSPDFAVPSLNALLEHFNLVGVITQPDRPAGRGRQLNPPSVKLRALEINVPVYQPPTMKSQESHDILRSLEPDLIVVAAYGQILPQSILDIPTFGIVNVHASLLPRWRGAAPVQAAILHGDDETGISLMLIDAGMDTGPILSQERIEIYPEDTGGELTRRLSHLGAQMLPNSIRQFIAGDIVAVAQDDAAATYAPMLRKADGELDFSKSVVELLRQIRAYEPWPSSFFHLNGLRIVVRGAKAISQDVERSPGSTAVYKGYPSIIAADGLLVLTKLQPSGKRTLRGDDYLRGMPMFLDLTAHKSED